MTNSPFYLGTAADGTEMYGLGPQDDVIRIDNYVRLVRDVTVVPEPGTIALLALGLGGMGIIRRRPSRGSRLC